MPSDSNLLAILEKTCSPNQEELQTAQAFLSNAVTTDIANFTKCLSEILADESCSAPVRMQAGLQLKNVLYSNDSKVKLDLVQRWMSISPDVRNYIKAKCLQALGTEKGGHSSAAQCVAYIACAELPLGQWTELAKILVQNVVSQVDDKNRLSLSSLEAIGYICQDIDPTVLTPQSNDILTAIVHGMKNIPNDQVKLAACTALLNSLEFYRSNFTNDMERNYIMEVICGSTQSENTQIIVSSLECLVKIVALYYEHMETYMAQALFPITVSAMKNALPEISLQGIEFWSSVCDVEIEIMLTISECAEKGQTPDVYSKHYAKGALSFITPILTEILTKQVDGADEDEWSPPKAASVCLMLLAQLCEDAIVPILLPFIQENIKNQDWRYRDAAILSFGSMLEGPDPKNLYEIVTQAFPFILEVLNDASPVVKDTAAWTISRICEIFPEVTLNNDNLLPLLQKLLQGLSDEPRVAVNICWSLSNLIETAFTKTKESLNSESDDIETFVLSQFYPEIINGLIQTTDRQDGNQSNLRNAAYSVLMDVIRCSPKDTYQQIQKVAIVILEKIQNLLQLEPVVPSSDRAQFNDVLSCLCGSLQSILRKCQASDISMIADKIAESICRMLSPTQKDDSSIGVQEDALLAVSAFVDVLEMNFINYLPTFMPLVINCLMRTGDVPVCLNAIGVVGDMSRVLGANMTNYASSILEMLVKIIKDPSVDKCLRPAIIEVFSDFSLAVGSVLHKYLDIIMQILQEATTANVNTDDIEMVEYLLSLRKSILEAYSGILNGIKDSQNCNQLLMMFKHHVEFILSFIQHLCQDPTTDNDVICDICALIGDLVKTFGPDILPILNNGDHIQKIIMRGGQSNCDRTKRYAAWAKSEIATVMNSVNQNGQMIKNYQSTPTIKS